MSAARNAGDLPRSVLLPPAESVALSELVSRVTQGREAAEEAPRSNWLIDHDYCIKAGHVRRMNVQKVHEWGAPDAAARNSDDGSSTLSDFGFDPKIGEGAYRGIDRDPRLAAAASQRLDYNPSAFAIVFV